MRSMGSSSVHVRARRLVARLLAVAAAGALVLGSMPAPTIAAPAGAPVVSTPASQAVASGDWPQFHNDPAHTGYNAAETTISASNVSTLGVAWTATTGGSIGHSSPVVANGIVYVGSEDGKLYAYAVGCNVGGGSCAPLWEAVTGSGIESAPAVDGGVVYIGSMDHKLYAFDAAGIAQCSVLAGVKYCNPLWTGTTGNAIWGSPAVANGYVYVGAMDGKVYAFSLSASTMATTCLGAAPTRTCNAAWTATVGSGLTPMMSSPAVVASGPSAASLLFVTSTDGNLYAFDPSGGWFCSGSYPNKTCQAMWKGDEGHLLYASPSVANNLVYTVDQDGNVEAYVADSSYAGCSGLSPNRVCPPEWESGGYGRMHSSPAVTTGAVYAGTYGGSLYGFDAYGSTQHCTFNGQSFVCSSLWHGVAVGPMESSPAIANGVVYVGSEDGRLYAYAAACATATCSPLWTSPATGGPIDSSPAVSNGVVYVGSNDGKLYAFALPVSTTHLTVAGLTSPRTAGVAGSITVTAKLAGGGTSTGYRGTVHFTSTDAAATLPADYKFTAGDAGVHKFNVTLKTAGTRSVTATDKYVASIKGSQTGIVVKAAPVGPTPTTYHAIAPARVLDSRPTSGEHTNIGLVNPFVAGTVRTFNVANAVYVGGGTAKAVPSSATAVTGNLTVVNESAAGVVALGPTMTSTGAVTTINFAAGDIRANGVTVGLGPGGTLQAVYRSSKVGATMHLIFDVTGFFTPDASGVTYHALAPGRVLDTRPTTGSHTNIGLSGKFANRVVRNFAVTGVTAIGWSSALVPVGAKAVTGNITVTNATTAGYVALGPTETTTPKTSTINIVAGANRANGVTVSLSSTGKLGAIWCGKSGSSADVIFDVTGFFTATATGLHYYPITPARYLDTSTGKGLSGKFANKVSRSLTVGGLGNVSADAKGISGNLTVIGPSSNGYAFISPTTVASPTSSTVNTNTGVNCANGFDVALGSGKVALIWAGTAGSTTNLQLDVTGYWK